jgi:hypothetical protein
VSVSNLYSLIAGLFEPTFIFRGVTEGAIIIHETGLPVGVMYNFFVTERFQMMQNISMTILRQLFIMVLY